MKYFDNIPVGWTVSEIGNIFIIERGGSPRPIDEYLTKDSNGINWIKIGDAKVGSKYIESTEEKIKPEGLYKSRMVYEGDFILSNSMSFGRPYIMKTSGCIHDGWLVIRKTKHISVDYLYYVLSSNLVYQQFSLLAKGSTVKNLNIEAASKVEIPIPPLNEQNRIVLKLDELFSELEKSKEQLRTAMEQLKIYRQSILKYAFEGKLTETKRKEKQYGETKELIKQVREIGRGLKIKLKYPKITDHKDLPSIPTEWQWIRNEELLKYVTSGSRDWKQYYSDSGSIFIRTQDIKTNSLSLDNTAHVKLPPKVEGKRSLVEKNDLLMTITGANVGKVAFIDKDIPEAYVSQSVALMKYLDNRITKFIWYYFQSRAFGKGLISNLVYGVGRPVLSLENMKEVPVSLCSIEEQEDIVNEIEGRFSVYDKLEADILQSLNQIEPFKQGLLQKAFEGKLVEQDINDEPATLLLERIKKERDEFLKAEKETKRAKKSLNIKGRKMAEELKQIIDILKENHEPVSVKKLWQSSVDKNDIDQFYATLKKHIEAGEIIEMPRKGKEAFLKLADVK